MKISQPTSIYLHIPFCIKKCGYCDFASYAGKENLIPEYVDCLKKEMEFVAAKNKEKLEVHTIFFGGGTPSLLSIAQLETLFDTIGSIFYILPGTEISLEANPGTLDPDYIIELKKLGINRLSIGVQSTNEKELTQLGRIHNRAEIFRSVEIARNARFNNLNLDLIYGLPDQALRDWKSSLLDIVDLSPEHISLYALTIEDGTPFGSKARMGLLNYPDPDLAADMYNWSSELLEKKGYEQYEISNWAKKGFECRHNLQTWRNKNYLGFGAGAHGFINNMRLANALRIGDYLKRIESYSIFEEENPKVNEKFPISPATVYKTIISRFTSMQETLMLGLRLTNEGVLDSDFIDNYGESIMTVFGKEISELIQLDLLDWKMGALMLTKKGRLLGNQVFLRFVN
jgi:oxygen-independent coproporphyrinogen-3 oxidase